MAKSKLSLIDRFLQFVSPEPNTGCWLWTATTISRGYGRFKIGERAHLAHRVAFELFRGPIPEELQIDHLCRVRCCVNPNHLEPVTQDENQRRGLHGVLLIHKSHCPRGHVYEGDNLLIDGKRRMCRICRNRECRDAYHARRHLLKKTSAGR